MAFFDELTKKAKDVANLAADKAKEAADPAEDEQDKSDSAFADMRRRLKEAEEKAAKLEAEREEYDQTLGLFFEGGSCVEDVTSHLMRHLSYHPTLRTCSSDTILRAEIGRAHV